MKKFIALILIATLLTSCTENVEIPENEPRNFDIVLDFDPNPEPEPEIEPEPTPEPEVRPVIEPELDRHELALAGEFLMQFPTIFSDEMIPLEWTYDEEKPTELAPGERLFITGWVRDDDYFEYLYTKEIPEIYIKEQDFLAETGVWVTASNFYDKNDNIITDEDYIWLYRQGHINGHGDIFAYATRFELWDFDNDGILEILVHFGGNVPGSGRGYPVLLYKYIDGEYRNVQLEVDFGNGITPEWLRFAGNYLLDPDGNLIVRQFHYGGNMVYSVVFDDSTATAVSESIARGIPYSDDEVYYASIWENLITGETDIPHSPAYYHHPTDFTPPPDAPVHPDVPQLLPGMDTPLIPLERLISAEEEIASAVKAALGLQ